MKLIIPYKIHKPVHISVKEGHRAKCGKMLILEHQVTEEEFEREDLFGLIICKKCLKTLKI